MFSPLLEPICVAHQIQNTAFRLNRKQINAAIHQPNKAILETRIAFVDMTWDHPPSTTSFYPAR